MVCLSIQKDLAFMRQSGTDVFFLYAWVCFLHQLFTLWHRIRQNSLKLVTQPSLPGFNHWLFQEEFDNDVDALLEEGMPVPKKMRPAEDKFGGDSDHQSDGEGGVHPMMTKIKTVLKSEWWICLF